MSVIACLAVHQCDLCGAVITTRNDQEELASSWKIRLTYDLCGDCHAKPEAAKFDATDNLALDRLRANQNFFEEVEK